MENRIISAETDIIYATFTSEMRVYVNCATMHQQQTY